MKKMRVSICGKKHTIEVPEGYKRVFKGRIFNGDLWFDANGDRTVLAHAEHASNIEDGWECIFRKIEDLPEPEPKIDVVIILVIV